MFHSRRAHPDIKKTTQKFLDPKKESHARLRALRTLLDCFDASDSKVFFQGHFSEIFYVFQDVFCLVEANLKQKGHRSQREDLDSVLFILEKILLLLPELLHKRWQFNSLGRIMRKLLHHGNALKLRREGARLFMLWFQALQENADELCQLIFASLIPGFPNPVDSVNWSKSKLSKPVAEEVALSIRSLEPGKQLSSSSNLQLLSDKEAEDWCYQEELGPIYPSHPSDKIPPLETVTKLFLDRVLDCMSTQLVLIDWTSKKTREHAFYFLFENFKKFYLPYIFPEWNPSQMLYHSSPVAQVPLSMHISRNNSQHDSMVFARESVLRWFVAFTVRFKRTGGIAEAPSVNQSVVSITSTGSNEPGSPTTPTEANRFSPARNKEYLHDASDAIRKVLYSTRENIQILHEVFRQGFLLPPRNLSTIRQVLLVYNEWIKNPEKPVFMLEPSQDTVSTLNTLDVDCPQSPSRTYSYSCAVDHEREKFFNLPNEDVRAGLQANLRLFILHSAEVFLVQEDANHLDKQVDLCKRVIHLCRNIVLEVPMESVTWEQLLEVLLEGSRHLLVPDPSQSMVGSIAEQVAGSLLQAIETMEDCIADIWKWMTCCQLMLNNGKTELLIAVSRQQLVKTLFVTWIRANLKVNVPTSLWDKCLEVISAATQWEEVISEWSITMETLTRVMARTVYGLDMADLPLDRLTERKRKRQPQVHQHDTFQFNRNKSFSRWSRMERREAPKQLILTTADTNAEKSSLLASPRAQKAGFASSAEEPRRSPRYPKVLFSPNSAFHSTSSSAEDNESSGRDVVVLPPTVAAGSATISDCEAAGQLQSSPEVNIDTGDKNNATDTKPHTSQAKGTVSVPSDTDSSDSLDTHAKGEQDSERRVSEESNNVEDSTDLGLFPSRLNRGSSSDSCLSHPDTLKSMEWYGSSLDFEVSSYSQCAAPEPRQLLGKISESSLECKLDESGLVGRRPLKDNRTSTPSGEIGCGQRDAREAESKKGVEGAEGFNHDAGGRSSPESSGRETPEDLVAGSRTPSPAHLDETEEELLEFEEEEKHTEEDTSVVAGGVREGWGPVAAVVLWRRMLGILGNVNRIKDPAIHAKVFECLASIWDMLAKIRLNQGISPDNKSTPPVPELIPPLQHLATWVFEAASLSITNEFKSGRLLAYKLMCSMTVCRQHMPLTQEYLTHFYRLMHIGLTGTDQDVTSAIVSSCAHFFSVMLPSSSLLILDFIQASNGVLTSQNMELPRTEAATLMGSLLCFPNMFPSMPLHQPGHQTNEYQPKSTVKDIKDKLIGSLLRASKLDPSCSARCVALNALGVFIVEELVHCQGHPRVHDCICVLLASITFHNKSICQVACDVIHLLSVYCKELCVFDQDLPLKIVEVLCHTIVNLLPGGESVQIQEAHKILVSVLMCLLDWLMVIPVSLLMAKKDDKNTSILSTVFQVLKMAASNKGPKKRTKQLNISTVISGDGRPIRLARLLEGERVQAGQPSSPVDAQPDSGDDATDSTGQDSFDFPPKSDPVKLTAKAVLMHLVNHMGHYPLGAGPSRLDSLISEHEDNHNVDVDELSTSIFNASNVQFFVLNDSVLMSLVELPLEDSPQSAVQSASSSATQVRVITRDMTGKNVWDYTLLHGPSSTDQGTHPHSTDLFTVQDGGKKRISDIPSRPSRPRRELRAMKSSTPVTQDRLDDVLCSIGATSHECLLFPDHSLNQPGPTPESVFDDMETDIIDSVLEQNASEKIWLENEANDPSLSSLASFPPPYVVPVSPFQLCRFVISVTGMMASEKRAKIDLLRKDERFLRELKNLDNRRCRETHKIAVLYVAQGQEDKTSIMSNCAGSEEYECFVAGLAWEVDLSTHTGFLGGLEKNLSTGTTAPYYCTSTTEVTFHVSTRMPLATDGTGFNTKVRHIGNDEVHIVWSEHNRDYRHGIVNTEFADVLIVIYPLKNRLFRIQIIKKPKVPEFGPLFDGALVDRQVLPSLVRATAINASRTKRDLLPLYERYYEEREKCIERIVKNHKELTTFEDFASLVFCPVPKPPGSEPPTPLMSGREPFRMVRVQMAAGESLSDDEKVAAIRLRSKSAVSTPRISSNKIVLQDDLSSFTSSLPDGLNKVTGGQTVTDGTSARQDKKRLSLRWRNKPQNANSVTHNDDSD